ncbi:hypothetical protein [Muricoccus radiodurans]|uniref:hypothetical protein n=1 Tax=Muricoccus radiodurans TaxID=2231721 RepID=UPI003CEEEFFB
MGDDAGAAPRGAGWIAAGSVLLGGLMLAWPAFVNGYPILFSDSGAFLHQTTGPLMIWDKPWIYGPLMAVFHWGRSLWPVVVAQGAMLSWMVWLLLRAVAGGARPGLHLLVCGAVAALTAAPFSAALLMPDAFTGVVVLGAVLLGFARASLSRAEAVGLTIVAGVGIAAHLSHLPVAGTMVLVALVLAGWRGALRVAAPLGLGIALLLVTNAVGHGRVSLSPYGATFLMARMVANGPAIRTIDARCPAAGWEMCGFVGRLDAYGPEGCARRAGGCPRGLLPSDEFLWSPESPVNRTAVGEVRWFGGRSLSGEAREIVAETIRREPVRVAWDAVRDTFEQLVTFRAGDTLTRAHVGEGVRPRIVEGFPPAEVARLEAGAQWRDVLVARVQPLLWVHGPAMAMGAVVLALFGWRWRRDRVVAGLAVCVGLGVLANAFSTGALSGPHDRYGARAMWVVVLAAMVLGIRAWRGAPYVLTRGARAAVGSSR